MNTTILIIGLLLAVNYDFERVYNFCSNLFFGGKKLTPKEF